KASAQGTFQLTVVPPATASTTTTTSTSTTTSSTTTTPPTTTSTSSTTTTAPTTTSSSTTSTTLPAGGTCARPIVLAPEGETRFGRTGGASPPAGTCAATDASGERVYQWTPAASGTATFQTCGPASTTFDTVLYVRTGSCMGPSDLACNDDTAGCGIAPDGTPPRRGSQVRLTVMAGRTYFVVVDGWSGAQGTFRLTVTPPAPPLAFARQMIDAQGGGQPTSALGAGDLDGDGLPDVVVGGDSQLLWYHNPDWTPRTIAIGRYGAGAMIIVRDVDGDGRNDVVTGEKATASTVWFGNTATG